MTPIARVLIKTHHITSREKFAILKKAAQRLDCAALLRTGKVSPGIMLAEGEAENLAAWTERVRRLRYKMYQHIKTEEVDQRRLDIPPGEVVEVSSLGEFTTFVRKDEELDRWWRLAMGFGEAGKPKSSE
ncbi:hypothetical protein ACMFMG_000435 [Clarireedia jacksonii]